jgi:hypothetical protein
MKSTLDGTERLERASLGLGQSSRASDIHPGVWAVGT